METFTKNAVNLDFKGNCCDVSELEPPIFKRKKSYFYSTLLGMDKLINVTDDYCFKGIFRDEARTKDFLENILIGQEKILPEDTQIQELEYLETEYTQNKYPEDAKRSVFDLQVKTNNGIFIIEMQNKASQEYLKRVEFYSAAAYSNQHIKSGKAMKDYSEALPVIVLSVINKSTANAEKIFGEDVPCVSYHINVERKTQRQYLKSLSYVFIELEKFDNPKYDQSNITDNERDWLLFLKQQNLDHNYKNEQVNSAAEYIKYIRDNKYDEYLRHQMALVAAQKELENAEIEGVKKGKIEGKTEEKIEIARKMLAKQIDIDQISEITGLSIKEIESLK